MKILYGVQATGNGHITRARVMCEALKKAGVEVDWMFSGRELDQYFDMECFGDFQRFKGLTFAIEKGQISYIKTAFKNNLWQFYKDVNALDLSGYDLVINDFEPISAWAAKKQKKFWSRIGSNGISRLRFLDIDSFGCRPKI